MMKKRSMQGLLLAFGFAVLGVLSTAMPLHASDANVGQCTAGDASAMGNRLSVRRVASAATNASTPKPAAKSPGQVLRGPSCTRPPAAICLAASCGTPAASF